ncbi:MAG: hypothetical protein ABIH37_01400 [archaeon]
MEPAYTATFQQDMGVAKKPVNHHYEVLKDIGSGALEGLFGIPIWGNNMGVKSFAYTLSGIPGVATTLSIFILSLPLAPQIIAIHGYKGLMPAAVLATTNLIAGYSEAVKSSKEKHEKEERQKPSPLEIM